VNKSGDCISTVPSFELSGQPAPVAVLKVACAYCACVHAPNPTPADGSIVTPSGNVTTVSFRSDCASSPSVVSPSVSNARSNANPLGEEAECVVGSVEIVGVNGTSEQPVSVGSGSLGLNDSVSLLAQEVAWRFVSSGVPLHDVGSRIIAGGCVSSANDKHGS
jgi:hypothetical protein